MSVRVSAVVISHDSPEWLRKTLVALASQTRPIDQIIAVDTSNGSESAAIFADFKITTVLRHSDKNWANLVSAAIEAAGSTSENQTTWYWLFHDDTAPSADALEKLLAAADLSPSVALLGPKLLAADQPNLIVQQGLTLTKLGGIFSLVENELDQAQHDDVDDVLAISTAGALIRADVFHALQGFDQRAPQLASDLDFSIRARLNGYRVVVVPSAHLLRATARDLSDKPKSRPRGNSAAAKRRAEIHLQLAFLPIGLVWIYAALLPANGVLRALWRIATKRSNLAVGELTSALWAFLTLPVRLASRANVARNRTMSVSALWPLRASSAMVRHRNRMLQDHVADEVTDTTPFEALSFEASNAQKRFAAAGGWFIALALLASSWQFWPTNRAATGGSLAPLSDNWLTLASRAGSSWQSNGLGLAAPSDPFNWLLTGIGALWFFTPSLALAVAVLLARSAAFAGAWHAVGIATKRAWIKSLLGIGYALWPSFLAAQNQARIGAILTWMSLPWLVLSVSKLLRASAGRRARASLSSAVGVSGLLFAVVALASPTAGAVTLVALAVLAAVRPRKAVLLAWVPALAVVLYAPYAWFMSVSLGDPLAILTEPGLPIDSARQSFWQIFLGLPNGLIAAGSLPDGWQWFQLWPSAFALLALSSLFAKRSFISMGLLVIAVVAAGTGYVAQRVWFMALEVNGSAAAALAIAAIALAMAAALALDQAAAKATGVAKVSASLASAVLALAMLASLASFGLSTPVSMGTAPALSFGDGRTVPAIVAAEAAQGSALRLLEVSQSGTSSFDAVLVSADGLQLENHSNAYQFALTQTLAAKTAYRRLDDLVANLVSANGTSITRALAEASVGYVLVPAGNSSDLNASLNSVSELELVGQTDFGWLWRVKSAVQIHRTDLGWRQTWSITKGIQVGFILLFLLLAIPGAPKRRAKNLGNIFVANDFFDAENVSPGASGSQGVETP